MIYIISFLLALVITFIIKLLSNHMVARSRLKHLITLIIFVISFGLSLYFIASVFLEEPVDNDKILHNMINRDETIDTKVKQETIHLAFLTEYYKTDELDDKIEMIDRDGEDGYQIIETKNTYQGDVLIKQEHKLLEAVMPINKRILLGSSITEGLNDGASKQMFGFINSYRLEQEMPLFLWDEQLYMLAQDLIPRYIESIDNEVSIINEDSIVGYLYIGNDNIPNSHFKIIENEESNQIISRPSFSKTAIVSYKHNEIIYWLQIFYKDDFIDFSS